MSEIREEIDGKLGELGEAKGWLADMEAEVLEKVEKVKAAYQADISFLTEKVKALDKEIKGLEKKHFSEVFRGADKVTLDHGVLLHDRVDKVQIPRDALGKIEAQGWTDGIKVVKTVDRPVVEKWPEEKLAVIGAQRKKVDDFSYELRGEG